jgi:hypothetical protein
MATLTDRQTIAANTSIANVLSGKAQEFVQEPSLVRLFATGGNVGLFCTLIVGDEVLLEDQEISAQNRFPLIPDDFVAEGGGLAGDRIVVKYRNSTAGAITAYTRVEIVPA